MGIEIHQLDRFLGDVGDDLKVVEIMGISSEPQRKQPGVSPIFFLGVHQKPSNVSVFQNMTKTGPKKKGAEMLLETVL